MAKRSERALIILGAGASIEYGIPATASGWNLREAETETSQRDDVGRSRHSARIVGTPSGSSAAGGEQTVLLVETQRLGG